MTTSTDGTGTGGTLPKAAKILGYFADYGTNWTIREVSEALNVPRSTLHRVCQQLVAENLLRSDENDRYDWGPELVRIAHAVYLSSSLERIARPVLDRLVAELNETALLTAYDYARHRLVFSLVAECDQPVRYHTNLGVPLPAHAGASGKSVLAFVPEPELEAVLREGLTPLTDATVTDETALRAELARIRAVGFAISHGERNRDTVGHACPVFGHDGTVLGSLCITVPAYRHDRSLENRIVVALRREALALSSQLGLPMSAGYPPTG